MRIEWVAKRRLLCVWNTPLSGGMLGRIMREKGIEGGMWEEEGQARRESDRAGGRSPFFPS